MSDTKSKPLKMIGKLPQLKDPLKHLMIVILIISISHYFLLLIVFVSVIILSQSYKRNASWINVKQARQNSDNADQTAEKSVPWLSV